MPPFDYVQRHLSAAWQMMNGRADGLRALGPTAITLSDMEGLDAHGNAVKVRLAALGQRA